MSSATAASAFSPPESSRTFCSRLPGGEHTISMPLSAMFSWSVSRISPVPPPNSVWNPTRKLALMASKASENFWRRNQVDFLNRLLGVADGIDQVLALGAQEIVALLRLLILLHGGGVDRAQPFDTAAHLVGRLLGFGDGVAIRNGVVGGGEFLHRAAQFLAAGFVEVLQLGLLAHQVDLDLRALLLRFLHRRAQSLELFFIGAQGFAHAGILGGHLVDLGFDRQ